MSLGLACESQFREAGQPYQPPSPTAYLRIQDHLLSHRSPEAQVRQGKVWLSETAQPLEELCLFSDPVSGHLEFRHHSLSTLSPLAV